MSNSQLLQNYSEPEKTAYLAIIASLSSADREASATEQDFLQQLTKAAGLSEASTQQVLASAKDATNQSVQQNLDALRGSDLRFSLITDLISFARSDGSYTDDEEIMINKIASYLQVNAGQQQVLEQVVDQAERVPHDAGDPTKQSFLGGLSDKLSNVGIPKGALLSGLLGVVAPMILSKVMSRSSSGAAAGSSGTVGDLMNSNTAGSSFGDILGGLMGGSLLGNVLGGSMSDVTRPYDTSSLPRQGSHAGNGGLGSLISILGGLGQQPNSAPRSAGGGGLGSLLGGKMGSVLGGLLNGNR
ncbi:TerB family tellurite resistance protein [Hymenobacter aerilatus]|uniref:TerB family tellurite resistance protein n=1 Tax=Hymenobacter aerilatus TaxID=2932251 RepID=A0A8T9SSQ3_9BACT|nr:TerB family tellurite resistance protein [Hymenobacter aerilatus]UOR04777.1 TerB family tellurite resistance protein [Hymenobacter aerilatus]